MSDRLRISESPSLIGYRTDGQTDRQTENGLAITAVCIVSNADK